MSGRNSGNTGGTGQGLGGNGSPAAMTATSDPELQTKAVPCCEYDQTAPLKAKLIKIVVPPQISV
jgi:hypothetical protein